MFSAANLNGKSLLEKLLASFSFSRAMKDRRSGSLITSGAAQRPSVLAFLLPRNLWRIGPALAR
jgi:hypothetical protein